MFTAFVATILLESQSRFFKIKFLKSGKLKFMIERYEKIIIPKNNSYTAIFYTIVAYVIIK
ncbi:hypothetical protein BpHYR1_005497 [Brachionus plicatilis]|uniref:Uncharacterized protein n=1 Tax=Brachionus plicatilis TaxID=10195 RepID=A0A3M7PAJ4_BRAPC|nr:hypothetical protein BpHYR1_005497 [Brachionus plicatilis]